jgi:hypothetical protein
MSTTQAVSRAVTPNDSAPAPHYRTIPVTNGPDARCDEEDFVFLSLFNWHAHGKSPNCYPTITMGDTEIYMHQLVVRNENKCKVNHRDRDAFNNCRANLRAASSAQVEAAKPKRSKRPCSSQYKGVSWNKRDKNWEAHIKVAGTSQWLGYFSDEEKAARAYDAAAYSAFGEFAYLNFASNRETVPTLPAKDEPVSRSVEKLDQPNGPQTIPVLNGPSALCDAKDFPLISQFTWRAENVGSFPCPVAYVCGRRIHMHYVILPNQSGRVTHKDGNLFNNCGKNLLSIPYSRILIAKSITPKSTSRFKGVYKTLNREQWRSTIIVGGTVNRLGCFANEDDAARAYDRAARDAFGPFACLNFPEEQSQLRS